MKTTRLLVMVITLIAAALGRAAESQYQYLIKTADEIYDMESRAMKLTPKEIAEIASRACKTLERLLADKSFQDTLFRMNDQRAKDVEQHAQMRRDLNTFVDSFLRPEGELLKKAGLKEETVKHMLWSAAYLHNSLEAKPDPKRIIDALERVRKDICDAAGTLGQEQENKEAQAKRNTRIKKWTLGIGGAVMIIVDATAELPTAGLATASFTLGGAMAGAAITD